LAWITYFFNDEDITVPDTGEGGHNMLADEIAAVHDGPVNVLYGRVLEVLVIFLNVSDV
jgi:hypothetical protein